MLDQVWSHKLVISESWRTHYVGVFTWLMLRPILLLTGRSTVGDLRRRKDEIRDSKHETTYTMACRTPFVFRHLFLLGTARFPTTDLQDHIFHVDVVVGPVPDIIFHPEVLSKPQVVLGIFWTIA